MAKAPRKRSTTSAQVSKKKSSRKTGASKIIEPTVIEPEIVGLDDEQDEGATDISSGARNFAPELSSEFVPDNATEIDPDRDVEDPSDIFKAIAPQIKDITDSDSKALTTRDPVTAYLAEIRRYPLLTKEQEQELAIRYRETGDSRAAEALVTSNLRFVVKIAAEYSRFGAKLIDLIQEGNVGLMHAVKEFNPYRGVRLITYAVWWIRGYIQEYLMRQYSMVRIGTTQNQRKLFYRLQKEREALDAMGQEPTTALLAGRLGVTEEEVESMSKRLAGRDISLNQPIDGENSVASLLDFEASDEADIDERLGQMEEVEVLKKNLEEIRSDLNEKETYILENRILTDEPLTLQEIGNHFGITREAVRQLEARLIGKIRNAVAGKL